MSNTPKDHLAKFVDAVIKGDNEAVDHNLKAALIPKTRAAAGLDQASVDASENEPTEVSSEEDTEEQSAVED